MRHWSFKDQRGEFKANDQLLLRSEFLPASSRHDCYEEKRVETISNFVMINKSVRPQVALPICFFFADADSLFPKGKPLVLLSAPVFLLIFPGLLAKSIHHKPIDPSAAENSAAKTNEVFLVET